MLNEHEAHRQHVLTLIENAQRAGRSEPEIVAIVERFFNTSQVGPDPRCTVDECQAVPSSRRSGAWGWLLRRAA
jgi:hypothetical protein